MPRGHPRGPTARRTAALELQRYVVDPGRAALRASGAAGHRVAPGGAVDQHPAQDLRGPGQHPGRGQRAPGAGQRGARRLRPLAGQLLHDAGLPADQPPGHHQRHLARRVAARLPLPPSRASGPAAAPPRPSKRPARRCSPTTPPTWWPRRGILVVTARHQPTRSGPRRSPTRWPTSSSRANQAPATRRPSTPRSSSPTSWTRCARACTTPRWPSTTSRTSTTCSR